MLLLVVVTVTTCPVETVALSAAVGTALASQVEALSQLPVVTDINSPGALETRLMSSNAAGGLTISKPSLFHEKINRYVVPGVPTKTIVSLFQAAELNLYIPPVAPGPDNCVAPDTAAPVVGIIVVGARNTFMLSQSVAKVPSPFAFHLNVNVTFDSFAGIVTSLYICVKVPT